jgi:hypothetical protein
MGCLIIAHRSLSPVVHPGCEKRPQQTYLRQSIEQIQSLFDLWLEKASRKTSVCRQDREKMIESIEKFSVAFIFTAVTNNYVEI